MVRKIAATVATSATAPQKHATEHDSHGREQRERVPGQQAGEEPDVAHPAPPTPATSVVPRRTPTHSISRRNGPSRLSVSMIPT